MVEALVEQVAWLTPTSLFLLINVVIATILVSNAFHKKPHQQPQPQHHHHRENHHHEDTRSEYNNQSSSTTAPPPPQPPLARTPSLFSRVTSFNYNSYYPYNATYGEEHHNQQQHVSSLRGSVSSPSLFSRVASFNFSGPAHEPETKEYQPEPVLASRDDFGKDHHVMRETAPAPPTAVEVTRAPSLLSRVASFTLRRGPQEMANNDDVDARREYVHVSNNRVVNGGRQESDKKTTTKKVNNNKKKNNVVENETTTFKKKEEKISSGGHHHQEGEVDAKADDFINRFKQQLKLQRIESLMRYRSA